MCESRKYIFKKRKKDKNRKGYGLDILRTLVDKYHGQMDTEIANGIYRTCISVENIELNEKEEIAKKTFKIGEVRDENSNM